MGPVADLLLGCGVLYMALFAAFAMAGPSIRDLAPIWLTILLALVLSAPHYGATLLRVYENREDRSRYRLFALHATLVVGALFVLGVHSVEIASWLFTVFIIWSPWHYTGQNYGLAVMFLRRRGVPLDDGLKRLLYASFALSWVMLVLVLYTGEGGADAARSYGASGAEKVGIRSLGIPAVVGEVGAPLVGFAYGAATLLFAFRAARRASLAAISPALLLVVTQALWFSLPAWVRFTGFGAGIDPLDPALRVYSFTWVALGHAVQYLWITSFYARSSSEWHGTPYYLVKAAGAGMALWTLPLLLFAPWSLGGAGVMTGDAGFYLLVSACINIHHFVLDGAIWKLRDSRIARALLYDPTGDAPARDSRRPWLRKLTWGVAAAGTCLAVVQFQLESQLVSAGATGDLPGTSRALDGLAWFGRDSGLTRKRLAKAWLDQGDPGRAIEALDRSLALEPDVQGFSELAYLEQQRGGLRAAFDALQAALALEPERLGLLHRAGELALALGDTRNAHDLLQRATVVDPEHAPSAHGLARARKALERESALASRGAGTP